MRHIAIMGMSFCGSTILSYVLGSLSGCATIGESHWLVDAHPSGRRLHCNRCRQDCDVLTDGFRAQLAADGRRWYARVGAALGTEVLVSSDKSPNVLERLAPERDFDALVLFKRPDRHAQSHVRVQRREGRHADLSAYLEKWRHFYDLILHRFPVGGEKRYLWIEDFLADPPGILRRLADWAGAPYDEAALQYWSKPHHAIGGNFNPYHWLVRYPADLPLRGPGRDAPVDADILQAPELSVAHQTFDRLVSSADRISA